MGIAITREDLARMYPRALPDWLDTVARLAPSLCAHYGFNRLDWCGMAGQIDAETDGLSLRSMQEDMRYSQKRMLQIYSKRLGDCLNRPIPPLGGRVFASKAALARALAGKPTETADCVYGGPHGREGTPPWQGSRYIGRGPLQNTHLNNYKASRDEIRCQPGGASCPDLVERPELLATDPELGVRDMFAQWKLKGLSRYAQKQDWATLADVLNTGNPNDSVKPHGLDRRLRATARALAIWKDDSAPVKNALGDSVGLRKGDKGGDVKRLQERLAELGYAVGPADGVFGTLTHRAIIAVQNEHGLAQDGIVGPRTMEVLKVTRPEIGPHTDIGAKDLTGSSTIKAATTIKRIVGWVLGTNVAVELDHRTGLGLVDQALTQGEQVKGLADRALGLGLPMPSLHTVVFVLIALVCVLLLKQSGNVIVGRVKAAIRGG